MMQIKDLEPKMGKVEITAKVTEIGEAREFSKFGSNGRVATATIQDDTGSVSLTLWNEQIDQVHVGDEITISNGFVNEWKGNLQLTTGRLGSLAVKK
jgi:replication factor A1